jgi:5-formyltetrahydrofolate cyclo-ligase
VEIVTIFQQKINEIIQIVLSLKNIAQEIKNLQHTVKQNKAAGASCCFFCCRKMIRKDVEIMDKKVLRAEMKETLSKLPRPLYEEYSYQIAMQLFDDQDWVQANVIGITISQSLEVDTYQIIRKAWEQGKQVAVPKCNPNERRMSFRLLNKFSQLETVYFGLLEPIVNMTAEVEPDSIDLIIVPGLAFTTNGFRIGFGGGYYDRFLRTYSGKTLSLAFPQQIIPSFEAEEHDIPVSKIITDQKVISI